MGWQRGTHDHHCRSHLLNVLVHAWLPTAPICAHVGSRRGRRRRRRRLNPSCWQKALIYINIHHSDKQMSDSSPIFQRKPRLRLKAPIITTSQDSPKSPPSKKPVPPSPVVPEIDSVSATSQRVRSRSRFPSSPASQQGIAPLGVPSVAPAGPRPKKNRRRAVFVPLSLVPLEAQQAMSGAAEPSPLSPAPQAKKPSRRQQLLKNKFLALQAVECNSDGASVEASENSDDDWCLHPPCSYT
jgi:hypothetical protein